MDLHADDSKPVAFHPDTRPVVRVTLTGPTLILTIMTMIVGIYTLEPLLMAILIALAPIPCVIYNDYMVFLSLGPGGTPPTLLGYLKLKVLACFAVRGRNLFKAPSVTGPVKPSMGYFQATKRNLASRAGPRPKIVGVAPQRQVEQLGFPDADSVLRKAMLSADAEHPGTLFTAPTPFEPNGVCLFAKECINETFDGEIAHVHDLDGSLHIIIHPMDSRIVLANGWGERHPLSQGGWMRRYAPMESVLLYAPRNYEEVEAVVQMIDAAIWWVTGKEAQLKMPPPATN